MGTSKNRQTYNLQDRLDELKQRSAWATGEKRKQLLEEIENVSQQFEAIKARRK